MIQVKAKKSLGQNFLTDIQTLETIANHLEVSWNHILEVWPWYGALTEYLLNQKPKSLYLVELDTDMITILKSRVAKNELQTNGIDFEIIHQDILKFEPRFWHNQDSEIHYFVIANIPYYITSPILRHFLYDIKKKPQKMLIMMQKEVGERILEGKVESERWVNKMKKIKSSVLSLMIAKKCFTEKVCIVPKTAFSPAPKVDSIVLAFEIHEKFNDISDEKFLEFIKICFSEPRKKLQNNLIKWNYSKESIVWRFSKLWFSELVRAEELSAEQIIELMQELGG